MTFDDLKGWVHSEAESKCVHVGDLTREPCVWHNGEEHCEYCCGFKSALSQVAHLWERTEHRP